MPDDDLAALVNLLEQAKVAIEETLEAVEKEHPGLEVSGYATQLFSFYSPLMKPGLITSLPAVKPGLADAESNSGCVNIICP